MNCNHSQVKIEAYLDGELTLSDRRDLEVHIGTCKSCQMALENMRLINDAVNKVPYVKAPLSLQRKIKSDLNEISGSENLLFNRLQMLGLAIGSAVFAATGMFFVTTSMNNHSMEEQFRDELTQAHVRSLMVDHAMDVVTSDSHVVKPWFSGKLDFSPMVKNLESEGFPLLGGRLEYLNKHPAAALIYKRREHTVNLFIYRDEKMSKNPQQSVNQNQSYNIVDWSENGLSYQLVSDLNIDELKQLAQLLRS